MAHNPRENRLDPVFPSKRYPHQQSHPPGGPPGLEGLGVLLPPLPGRAIKPLFLLFLFIPNSQRSVFDNKFKVAIILNTEGKIIFQHNITIICHDNNNNNSSHLSRASVLEAPCSRLYGPCLISSL